jgi:hypothetical protein
MRRVTGFSRMRLGLLVVLGFALGAAVLAAFAASSGSTASSSGDTATSTRDRVKIIVAGTNDSLEEQTDGGITGEGTFRATGTIKDKGTARGYRGLSTLDPKVILLRYVTWGKKGTVTYALTIDTNVRPVISRWRIESGTKAYKGLQGKGTETENATWTVSTLKGTVWR